MTPTMSRGALLLAAGILVLAGCSDSEPDSSPEGSSTTATTTTTAASTSTASDNSAPTGIDIDSVALQTSGTGLGERPLLEWTPIDGADEYRVVVRAKSGGPYWAWVGRETSVWFGGGDPAVAESGQLARLTTELLWSVSAWRNGEVLALSEAVAIAP